MPPNMSEPTKSVKYSLKSWSNNALTPRQLLQGCTLPQVVKCQSEGKVLDDDIPKVDFQSPLLLYKKYTSNKIQSRNMKRGNDGKLRLLGPPVMIPEEYTGWFAVVTDTGKTAPSYSSIEQIACAKIPFFLTCYEILGYKLCEKNTVHGRNIYSRTIIPPGHVLKLLGIFQDISGQEGQKARSGSPHITPNQVVYTQYAQCLNHRNEIIFIAFSATGRFYAAAPKGSHSTSQVYMLANLLRSRMLPLTVRLVCGYLPKIPPHFTGLMYLERSESEELVLASTFPKPNCTPTLFEMDLDSDFKMMRCTDDKLPKNPLYLATLSYCHHNADGWKRQIKVTHHVEDDLSLLPHKTVSSRRSYAEPSYNVRQYNLSDIFPKYHNRSPEVTKSRSHDNDYARSPAIFSRLQGKSRKRNSPQLAKTPLMRNPSPDDDVPYATVRDDVTYTSAAEENIYAEISEIGKDAHDFPTMLRKDVSGYCIKIPGFYSSPDTTMSSTNSASISSPEASIYNSVC